MVAPLVVAIAGAWKLLRFMLSGARRFHDILWHLGAGSPTSSSFASFIILISDRAIHQLYPPLVIPDDEFSLSW